ncbi:M20/M25/M40 family metallo-hydrolase [Acuticoccus mangrovi]|uniref:M20/M25/M40 family metallo-hydrolase n=1 Tax=Acuticoccus mangrovi TaxID=2796142 RepID=A0A934MJ88_9HYPH|nr:M20/M25/M40 family metallo-hydrolase [Acuticoccus mangrovi]MBJ3774329.1 M20/M25/M40 family metallo-hydrolase [Acuticoccus mangrovi]
MSDLESQLLAALERDEDNLISFFQKFLQSKSANPPGDTRPAADTISEWLSEAGVDHRIEAAKPHMPNVVGTIEMGAPGRHLVLNGHIDVFAPIDDSTAWTGEIKDGRIYGRGASDMKCGTAASIITYAYLSGVRDQLKGKLTLTCVSDEETGGRWGTLWLMETFPDEVLGDCCLNGEPSGTNNIRFLEKGTLRFTLMTKTAGGHGGYPHLSPNAIVQATEIINGVLELHGREPELPEAVARALLSNEGIAGTEKGMGEGAAKVVRSVTVNIGTIHGGLKVNQIPHECRTEIEIRFPWGFTREEMLAHVDAVVAKVPGASYELDVNHSYPPSLANPEHEMVKILADVVEELGMERPIPLSSLGGSDSRYWRWRDIPAFLYGPSPVTMGRADENVTLKEFLHIVKTHCLASARYLSA